MRVLVRFPLLLLAWGLLLLLFPWQAAAQEGTAFSCDGTFYQIRQTGTTSSLFFVDRSTAVYTTKPVNVRTVNGTATNDLGVLLNGLAYNSQDGYMYGIFTNGNTTTLPAAGMHMYKIGQGGIRDLGATNLPALQIASGTIDKNGKYYVSSQNTAAPADYRLYTFDLNSTTPLTATSLPFTTTAGAAQNLTVYDLALNPADGLLYGVNGVNSLYQINPRPAANRAEVITINAGNAVTAATAVGTSFFDVAGNMFTYTNGTPAAGTTAATPGNFYSVNLTSGVYSQISTVDPASVSDGASCINPDQRLDVVKALTQVVGSGTVAAGTVGRRFDITFSLRVKNTSTATDINVQINDFLWSGVPGGANGTNGVRANTTFASVSGQVPNSVTILSGPTVAADPSNVNPVFTLAANAGFRGYVDGATNTSASLLTGTQPLTAGQAAMITFTVRVLYATTGQVPASVQNSAYASSTSLDNTPGYTQNATSGLILTPDNLQAADISTNGSSLPATANADTPTPTPVYFLPTITGKVFEDVNYGGGAGRSLTTSNGVGVSGARVELYSAAGAYLTFTTTNANGDYVFTTSNGTTALVAGGYQVRVVNGTVVSTRPNPTNATGLLPVQTFISNGTISDVSRVGGENPGKADYGNSTAALPLPGASATNEIQSVTTVTLGASATVGVDFGFNFDAVVNTNDAGQGSLRQFITNSNALGGEAALAQAGANAAGSLPAGKETSIFMIPSGAATNVPAGQRIGLTSGLTNGVAIIKPATALPSITGPNTSIDGTTQTFNVGNTNTGQLGTGGPVGVGADGVAGTGDELTLSKVDRPEVQLQNGAATPIGIGLNVQAVSTTIRGLSVLGFGTTSNSDTNANILVGNVTNFLIEGNLLGIEATRASLATSTTATGNGDNLRIVGGSGDGTTTGNGASLIQNNLIGYVQGKGIGVESSSTGVVIRNNEVRNNGIGGNSLAGIDIESSSATVVTGNYVADSYGVGIDSFGSTGSNTIVNNTVSGNGRANSTSGNAGVRVFGNDNTVSQNIIANNVGAGIAVPNSTLATTTGTVNNGNVLTMNSISGNGAVAPLTGSATGQIGIDLLTTGNPVASGAASFVSYNDNGDADTGANGLLNFPVIESATVRNGTLLLTGFAKAGAVIEFFIATPNAASLNAIGANFGQGSTYLFSRTEGAGTDLDATTGSYGQNNASVNGFYQGTEINQNRFSFAVPLSSLTATQQAALAASGVKLTATATITSATAAKRGTSEFSGNAPVQLAPVANNDFVTTTPGTAITLTATANDQNNIDAATVALNGLAAGSTTAVTVTGGTFQFLSNGQVQFTPAAGFTGIATIPYTVKNTSGTVSNTAYISVEVKGTTFNLATSVSGPASANAGASVTYNVTASNPGSVAATGVVETVQLPAGLATTGFTVGGSTGTLSNGVIAFPSGTYNQSTGVLTLTIGNLAATSGSVATVVTFPAPGSSPLTITANISGNGGPETTTADNIAVVTTTLTPRYDVTTTISGPTAVTAGNEVTYTILTSNVATSVNANSVSPASNVIQTVTLPGNVTGIYASNGGTVSFNSASNTTTVTFPAISTLATGQAQVNTISFVAPSGGFLSPVAVVTSGPSNSNTGDINSPTTGTNNNTAYLNGATTRPTVASTTGTGTATNVYTTIMPSATSVAPGANITLTITASNAGPAAAAGVQETVALPAGLTFSNSGGGTYDATTGLLTFPALTTSLAVGSTQTYTVTFAAPQQGFVLATATVSTTNADLVPNDNVAEAKIEVAPTADVATTLAGPVVALPGQAVSYTVTTANNGVATANSVVQTVQLPAGLASGNVKINGQAAGTTQYDATTGVLIISFADPLAQGYMQTNTITFTAPASMNSYAVVATVSTSTNETTTANNTATVTTTLTPTADVAISATAPASAVVGNQVLYLVSTANNGAAVATGVVPTLQLPAGLGATSVTFPGGSGTGAYDNTTGLVTFPTVSALASGARVANEVVVKMPDVAQLSGVARVTTTGYDTNLDNNYASVATIPATATTNTADLSVTLTPATATTNAGATVTLTATFSNGGTSAATNVVPQLFLRPGLANVTVNDGGTVRNADYDAATGIVTFQATSASLASLASGASLPGTYSVSFTAPASGPIQAIAAITSATSDANLTNNTARSVITITPQADATTSIAGPTSAQPGSKVTYAVTTANITTLSPSTNVVQTVTVPNTVTNLTYPAGSTTAASGASIVITFPAIASLAPGAVATNYVSFTTPATPTSVAVSGSVTSAADTNPANNSATTTTISNRAPVAYNVVNSLQSPEGNTATAAMPISPLLATDAEGNTLTYTVTSLPASGTLYLADGTTQVTTITVLTAAQAAQLRYLPATGFVGNAFFSYTATDNASVPATSNAALYTIQVGADNNSVYTKTPVKGAGTGAAYQNDDVLAYVVDANGARYTSTSLVYDAKTGTLLTGASNGLPTTGTNATLSAADVTNMTLTAIGVMLNPTTGQLYVADRTKLKPGTYSVTITTTDVGGGTNAQLVSFTIGANPLPVELTSFVVKAVKTDALLTWSTASEKNNDHFAVERSFDGRTFVVVGQVAGHGSTSQAHDYRLTDFGVGARYQGTVYYRLRQVDADSTSQRSPVRTVAFTAEVAATVALYPNPAAATTTLDLTALPAGAYQVTLLDMTGRLVLTSTLAGGQPHPLAVDSLPAGSYVVLVRGGSATYTVRLVKK